MKAGKLLFVALEDSWFMSILRRYLNLAKLCSGCILFFKEVTSKHFVSLSESIVFEISIAFIAILQSSNRG